MTGDRPPGGARAVATYSLARLLVLVAVAAVLYLAGLRGTLLVLVALLGSGVVSYVLLAPQRAAMAVVLERSLRRRPRSPSARIAASAAAEDAYVDRLEADRDDGSGSDQAGRHGDS